MEIRGAIFDLDGTLLDSMFMWDNIATDYLAGKGIKGGDDLYEKLSAMTLTEAAELFKNQYDMSISTEQIVAEICQRVDNFYSNSVFAKEGTKELLEEFSQRNIPLCIATATERSLVEKALKRTGLIHYFKEIFTCPDVGIGKDKPDIYHIAMNFLGTSIDTTLVFEDALHAVKTAVNAGYTVVGLYDNSSKHQWKEIKSLCAVTFNSLADWDETFFQNLHTDK